jgi:hypothetical protein
MKDGVSSDIVSRIQATAVDESTLEDAELAKAVEMVSAHGLLLFPTWPLVWAFAWKSVLLSLHLWCVVKGVRSRVHPLA